jgi:hypothetical protein
MISVIAIRNFFSSLAITTMRSMISGMQRAVQMSWFLFAYLFVSCPCHNCGNYVVTSPKYRGSFIELRAAATADVEHFG